MLEKLIVFVEEPSMEAALEILLPRVLEDVDFQIICFQCKSDLLKRAPERLRGYASWLPESWRILILVDRDDEDCVVLKSHLEEMTLTAGLISFTVAGHGHPFQVVNRIAIEELEAWFFGDWSAVHRAFPRVSATLNRKAGFRDPDAIQGGTWEAMERALQGAGYFSSGLRKVELARSVARHMSPELNTSRSFQAFMAAVRAALSS